MEGRVDVVVYGATGFTGERILQVFVESDLFKDKPIAVSGRSESKLQKLLDDIAEKTGRPSVRSLPIFVASTDDAESLAAMARGTRLVINAVGPFRLHGEPVVRAAVENGAHYIDVAGEPAFIEKMQQQYDGLAREKGVCVVGACGWDCIPCDLGVDLLKRKFDGTLAFVETVIQHHRGPAGYSFNATTFESLMLGLSSMEEDDLGGVRRSIMPQKMPKTKHRPPERPTLWHLKEKHLYTWTLPFPTVQRSQYYDYVENEKWPVQVSTYCAMSSLFWASAVAAWMASISVLSSYETPRKFLMNHPELASGYTFKTAGPSQEQMEQSSCSFFVFGTGWERGERPGDETTPRRKEALVCRGPDPGYIGTAGCVASATLAILNDTASLPPSGGVITSASAFGNTNIYEYLRQFGITFEFLPTELSSKM